jgi:uncharacterized protein (TIGR02246 family)
MNDADVLGLFDQWNTALSTLNPDTVTALYADNAVLLPTVSNQVRHNHEEIRDYFVGFLQKAPQGVVDEFNVNILSDTHVTNSGGLHLHLWRRIEGQRTFQLLIRRF